MSWPWRIIILCLSAVLLCVFQPITLTSLHSIQVSGGACVTGYSLNNATGEFSAHLNGSCSFTLGNSYELKYLPVIRGMITQGRLQKLSGVSVKVVLLWLNIVEVERNNQRLKFSVGFTSADFPVENFEECPQCGCGLDCGGGRGRGRGIGNGVGGNWSSS